ncbi:hypothetical protein BGX27_010088 [Mortierella sp. AM989]|nr:hypothetical protein BGX27_010088 [Mortierella sp. AM989]
MHTPELMEPTTASHSFESTPVPQQIPSQPQSTQQQQQQKQQHQPLLSITTSTPDFTPLQHLAQPQSFLPSLSPIPNEFAQGEDVNASTNKNANLSSRIGSIGSQLGSPISEVRKRTGRRVAHRPRPLDLDYSKRSRRSSQQQQLPTVSGSGPEVKAASAIPSFGSGSGTGLGEDVSTSKGPKHKAKFPSLHIKTDLNPPTSFRWTNNGPTTASVQNNSEHNAHGASNTIEVQRREPSKYQVELERILKKIQNRKRAPSNLSWYAAHSTKSYLAGKTTNVMKEQQDTESESLYFGVDKPPRWAVNSMQENELFFTDDTVELVLKLRDYLIKAKQDGWDITELKEEIFPVDNKTFRIGRRNRSVSSHGSPLRSPNIYSGIPTSPDGASQDSPSSSRHGSRSSIDLDSISQQPIGRYLDEETGSYRLLDYFLALLSDIISHDCRYRIQHPRPSRPEWILHTVVLDVLVYLSKELLHDHKAIYDIGMISLSAFPIFKNNMFVRLLELLTGVIIPSFAQSRTKLHTSVSASPPLATDNPGSPLSPSEIRVRLDNNQTFAIQVHSPTEEQGISSVPQQNGQSLNSSHMPNSKLNTTSIFKTALGPTTQARDTMDAHASSLIGLTLLAMLQQISFLKSPLAVAKQLEASLGDLLRAKPNISTDLLEVIAIVENEIVMRRALEVLWWIGKPSLGHLILSEKFFPLDYDSILQMRQTQKSWTSSASPTIGARSDTVMSETLRSFRKGTCEEEAASRSDVASRPNSSGSFGTRSKRTYRRTMPWKSANGLESTPIALRQHDSSATTTPITDYLADHELYPYIFPTIETKDQDVITIAACELCEVAMSGFGLYCYHCRGALHLDCFYSVKRYAGVDCMQVGCALDILSPQLRNQLVNPAKVNGEEQATSQTCQLRDGHRLRLVNMFSTCLCSACKLPLWGYHYQGYKCEDCSQLMHLECQGSPHDCETAAQPLAHRHSFCTRISYKDLRQSFLSFYCGLVSTWECFQMASSFSPATRASGPPKDRYSYEEASCNASALTLQLELLKAGISRGEIQVQEWMQGQIMEPTLMESSGFELLTLQKYFTDLVNQSQDHDQAASRSLFLSDFLGDGKPDTFLLFSPLFWSHFAALAKTMIDDSEASERVLSNNLFTTPTETSFVGEDIFEIGTDTAQGLLAAGQSVQSPHVPLAAIYRFVIRRLEFRSSWTVQIVLQEWVKIGLLERLDGELCLFENATREATLSPPTISLTPSPHHHPRPTLDIPSESATPIQSTLRTSYFDSVIPSKSNNLPSLKNVHCLFPVITAIDPSSDVENLIHSVWRCLGSVDLSVNECGFLLLTRQCWPDPFMSDYTAERLLGCILHWLLMEDEHLTEIHKNYASKSKLIPGIRSDLEERVSRKRIALRGSNLPPVLSRTNSSMSVTATGIRKSSNLNTANITNGTNISASSNSRSNSANSNHFGTVGSYVMTRKLMAKKFALPWLKKVLDIDPKQYSEIVYRQIRILEREMATEGEGRCLDQEEHQAFRQFQSERYLESITKLRNAGFLFNKFSSVLCHWLEDVEGLLNGMGITNKNYKTLNRLFVKVSSRSGSGLGYGAPNSNHPSLDGQPRTFSDQQIRGGSEGNGIEWRSRLRAKLHQGLTGTSGSSDNLSENATLSGHENLAHDSGETPLDSLRLILKPPQDHTNDEDAGIEKALFWLDIMVHSGVQVPPQAFLECCESLLGVGDSPILVFTSEGTAVPTPTRHQPSNVPLSATSNNSAPPSWAGSSLLELSRDFLKTCWDHVVLSVSHMSEVEVGEILETVLAANEAKILLVMNSGIQGGKTKELESVRQLVQYALALMLYVYGCPLDIILSLEITPLNSNADGQQSQQDKRSSINSSYPQFQNLQRQQRHSTAQVDIDRDAVSISVVLKCLLSFSLSLQSEVIKGLAALLEHSKRVANTDKFMDSIHMDVIPCLWDLLSPLNDHMSDITIPLLMRFISQNPASFHKVVSRRFNDREWEIRFAALDPVFGLFSKLDDALVLKLFFQQTLPTTSPVGTMLNSKGKITDKHLRQKDRQQYLKKRAGASPFEPEGSENGSTGLSWQAQNHFQQNISQAQFLPEHLQILGPVFSFFASSMWDKEEAVRTKAKTLLKSLQPVHVIHALKSWELHFIASSPETQQALLKLMTRLNNYFPGWRIMSYDLMFTLLTNEELGRPLESAAGTCIPASNVHSGGQPQSGVMATPNHNGNNEVGSAQNARAQGSIRVSLPYLRTPRENLSQAVLAAVTEEQSDHSNESVVPVEATPLSEAPSVVAPMPTGETSRTQKRASVLSAIPAGAAERLPQEQDDDLKAYKKQLALEDDISCSLLNLALQMVANGIEPSLKEVIQLKYLVVYYLDFQGCKLSELSSGKSQVLYGEYIPRQRASPVSDLGNEGFGDEDSLRNDQGHENFVLSICQNLQLILDRYVEIKPDYEVEALTLYERNASKDPNQHGVAYEYDEESIQSDPQLHSPSALRTFSTTTATSIELTKLSTHNITPNPNGSDDDHDSSGNSVDENEEDQQNMFCFPRRKHKQDRDFSTSFNQQSTVSQKNLHQQGKSQYGQHAIPRYQQQQHHHYRRNQYRRQDRNAPVVGTYFVDVILRFFGSESDLSVLPVGRLKSWLELLLIVIYKYVREVDPLSDLVVVLMKRIIEMLMSKKGSSTSSTGPSSNAGSAGYQINPDTGRTVGDSGGIATTTTSFAGEEILSEENILLAISICSTLLKRSSTMTTALLSREIMAMGRLMTRRRFDPEDPVLIRAKNFLHDAFVHFMGNGLFVLVFKTQTSQNTQLLGLEEEGREVDQDLDLFYVLATVLGEDEMVPHDPTSNPSMANVRLVHFRDQPIRDILDRVTIFKALEPVQVSSILTNLALYVERVHSKFEDPHLIPDMAQFLIKITKYTADWDLQQQQKLKEFTQQRRQEQFLHQQMMRQQLQMKQQPKGRQQNHLFSGNSTTVISNGSSPQLLQYQQQQGQQRLQQQQRQGVISMTSGSITIGATEFSDTAIPQTPQAAEATNSGLSFELNTEPQRSNIVASTTLTSIAASSPSSHTLQFQQQGSLLATQPTVISSSASEAPPPKATPAPLSPTHRAPPVGRKAALLMDVVPLDLDTNPAFKTRIRQSSTFNSSASSSPRTFQSPQSGNFPILKRIHFRSWEYSNAIIRMCSVIMVQNPLEGHSLIAAAKNVLKQALYRDKISAQAMIRLVTGYCFMAELDFSLSLVNVFGEFVVEELRASIANNVNGKYEDETHWGDETEDILQDEHHTQGRPQRKGTNVGKERDSTISIGAGVGSVSLGIGAVGPNAGVGNTINNSNSNSNSGRSKILASNFHLLHHLLIWDLNPNYNLEWTQIKWEILGPMRFPPGHPILFPGANDDLRKETAAIVSVWADKYPS